MFEEKKVEEQPILEKPKKERKKRKPMTEEQKQVLRDRLKKAREAKKAKKEAGSKQPPAEKKVAKSLPAEPKIEPQKPAPPKQDDELFKMRKELESLRTINKNQERELVRQAITAEKLKKEGMAYLAKAKSKSEKLKSIPETKPVELEVADKPKVEQAVKPPPKKRYSTYQKSVWSKFE